MDRKLYVACIFFILFLASYSVLYGDNAQDQPNAVMLNDSYKFDKILEGTKLVHDFVIQNRGDAILEIKKIQTG